MRWFLLNSCAALRSYATLRIMHRKLLYIALVLAALLLALHLYALQNYLYWHHRWLDIPMHILGGIAIGALFLSYLGARRALLYFALMLGVVLFWEIFENVERISTGQPDYWFDTTKDIINGLIGSAISFWAARKGIWR